MDAIVGERHVMLLRLKQAEDSIERSRTDMFALRHHRVRVQDECGGVRFDCTAAIAVFRIAQAALTNVAPQRACIDARAHESKQLIVHLPMCSLQSPLLDDDVADAVRLDRPPKRPVEPQTAAVRHARGLETTDLTPHDPAANGRRAARTDHLEVHEASRYEPVQRLELRAARGQVDQPGIDRGTHPHGDDAVLGHRTATRVLTPIVRPPPSRHSGTHPPRGSNRQTVVFPVSP